MKQAFLFFWRNKKLRMAIFVLFLVPILFNTVALWNEIGFKTLSQAIIGNYVGFSGFGYNPLPEIYSELLAYSLILTTFSIFIIMLANLKVLMSLPIILKFLIRLIIILPSSVAFSYASGVFMPLSWLPIFNDYLLGLPVSEFAYIGSWVFVFPTTIIVFLLAARFFERNFEPSTNNTPSLSPGDG